MWNFGVKLHHILKPFQCFTIHWSGRLQGKYGTRRKWTHRLIYTPYSECKCRDMEWGTVRWELPSPQLQPWRHTNWGNSSCISSPIYFLSIMALSHWIVTCCTPAITSAQRSICWSTFSSCVIHREDSDLIYAETVVPEDRNYPPDFKIELLTSKPQRLKLHKRISSWFVVMNSRSEWIVFGTS